MYRGGVKVASICYNLPTTSLPNLIIIPENILLFNRLRFHTRSGTYLLKILNLNLILVLSIVEKLVRSFFVEKNCMVLLENYN